MSGLFNKHKKEKTETSNARENDSGINLMANMMNKPYQHHQATLPSTSAAPVQMQAVSSLASEFTQMQGHTMATTNSTALELKPSKKREQSRISSTFTIGQQKAFNKVCDCLTKSEVGMVGIHGMGGVGKTTLMKKVCYEFLEPSNFKVIWIVVSRTVNVGTIQKSIMEELNMRWFEEQDPQSRGMKINKELLNSNGRVALLLDDIWESLDLEELGVAGGHRLDTSKFKIIFTTRSEDVCLQMDPDQKMKIKCLGPKASWALFKQSVGDKPLNSHDQILGLAKEVAKECAGLPLALTIIGKAMVCKTSLGAWKDALTSLKKISGAERKLFERLKFSYDNLENQVERECFLFCCMYPEDHKIDKDTLVGSWIGEGLLDVGYGTYEETWNRGHNIIDTLVAKSLLEVMQSKYSSSMIVKMHDVIRDTGLWIGSESNYFVHTASLRLSGEEIVKRWNTARWIYVEDHNDDLPQELDCPNLSSLYINCAMHGLEVAGIMTSMNFKCKVMVLIMKSIWLGYSPIPMFQHFVGLRHLEIKDSNMEVLPPGIGNLTKLLALILLDNDYLYTLPPSIGGLCELRKLQIRKCARLENIPSEGKLKKLEMVDILAKKVVYKGNIFNECTELRRLHLKVEVYNFKDLPSNSKKLEELHIEIQKKYLIPESGPFLIEGLKRLTSLKVLTMDGWPTADGDEVIFAIEAMCRLRELRIIICDIDKLVIPAPTDFLPQLEVLEIKRCRRLEKVHFRKRALQSLCILKIGHCSRLAHVVGLQHLLQLRELDIEQGGLSAVTTTDDDGHGLLSDVQTHSASFPNLQRLRLQSFRWMKHICNDNVSFPSLSEFRLYNCPRLKKLPRGLMNENRTTPMISGEIVGREEWWEGLEWEDDAFKSYLRPLFRTPNGLVIN